MRVIKRYSNRKLYDTEARQYITLDSIADLIRQGEEVQIIDNRNGDNLTALTLSQILCELEKKRAGFLPHAILATLVQAGGNTLASLRHSLASQLGLWQNFDEEIERRIQSLILQGELSEEEASRFLLKLLERDTSSPKMFWIDASAFERLLNGHGLLTREDLYELAEHVDALEAELEALRPNE